jgi:hypothetical protein
MDLLAARARRGDRRAAAELRRRMTPQAHQLALALSADPRSVPALVRQALADAVADEHRPYGTALVAAVQRRAGAVRSRPGATVRSPADRLQQAVGVLCDVQGQTHAAAAALLGRPVAEVAALHEAVRADQGVEGQRAHCRGWHLVSRTTALTPPEQAAAEGHLAICRSCRDGLAARALARRRLKTALPVGGTAVGGGVAALLSTVGGGSVATGTVAAGTAAVLGIGGLVAVAPPEGMKPDLPAPASVTVPAPPASPDVVEVSPSSPGPTPSPADVGPEPAAPAAPAATVPAAPAVEQQTDEPPPQGALLPLPETVPLPTLSLPPEILPSEPLPQPSELLTDVVNPLDDAAGLLTGR